MDPHTETVHITLEDIGPASWWAGALVPFTHQGRHLLRFVACQQGRRRCTSPTFPAPHGVGPVPPRSAWTPAMSWSFETLCRDLEADGWTRGEAGVVPWAFTYVRGDLSQGAEQRASARQALAVPVH